MRKLVMCMAAVAVLSAGQAFGAASIVVNTFSPGPGFDGYVFQVDPLVNFSYDTIDTLWTANPGQFFNQTGGPTQFAPAGTGNDTAFSGLNLTAVGFTGFGVLESATGLQGTWVSLGSNNISGPPLGDPLTIAQIVVPTGFGGSYTFRFANDGLELNPIGGISGTFGVGVPAIPEPTMFAVGLGLIGIVVSRRSR